MLILNNRDIILSHKEKGGKNDEYQFAEEAENEAECA